MNNISLLPDLLVMITCIITFGHCSFFILPWIFINKYAMCVFIRLHMNIIFILSRYMAMCLRASIWEIKVSSLTINDFMQQQQQFVSTTLSQPLRHIFPYSQEIIDYFIISLIFCLLVKGRNYAPKYQCRSTAYT